MTDLRFTQRSVSRTEHCFDISLVVILQHSVVLCSVVLRRVVWCCDVLCCVVLCCVVLCCVVFCCVVCNRLAHDIGSVGFCAHGNEKSVSVKCGNHLD